MTRAQRPLILTLIGILTALVVVLAALVVIARHSGRSGTLARATATPMLLPTPTPVLPISPAQGWVASQPALPFMRAVAFGTNAPLTGYACGSQGLQSGSGAFDQQPVVLQLSSTTDGGRTWQTPQTLSFGKGYATCELHIDPADAKEVLLGRIQGCDVGPCEGNTGLIFDWYRSRDGGQTWNHLTYPTSLVSAAAAKGYFLFDRFTWDGTTLYAAVNAKCLGACYPSPPNTIMVSKSGGAFVALPTASLYAAMVASFTTFVTPVLLGKGTLSLLFAYQSPGPWGQVGTLGGLISRDGGQSWTTFIPMCNGATPLDYLELKATTQTTFWGLCNDPQKTSRAPLVVHSTDGQTWTALAAQPPGDFTADTPFFVTPDGTGYVATTGTNGGILRLAADATAWQLIDPAAVSTPYHYLAAVSWDITGHTVAIWGQTVTTKIVTGGPFGPTAIPASFGLAYHTAVPGP